MAGDSERNGDQPGRQPEDEPGAPKPSDSARGGFDEAQSAFTSPQLMPVIRPPEEEHPTSEFAVPEGLRVQPPEEEQPGSGFEVPEGVARSRPEEPHSKFRYGPQESAAGFTPAEGIPALRQTMSAPWQDRMRSMVRLPLAERPAPERVPRGEDDEPGPPVPRVLDLTLRIGELLLASGEGAEDVEAAMFAIAHAYGLARCEANVTFTLISIAHQPSLVEDPVSLGRTVRRRGTDYTRLAAVFRLVDDITSGGVSLEEAYGRLAAIRRNRHPYKKWQVSLAAGLLAGAASVLVGGSWLVFILAALGAILGDRLAWILSSRGLPEFYQFVAAAMAPAAFGVVLAAVQPEREGLIRAASVITGGLFALIPGRALVASVQDGLTGYYLTASARLLEVMFLIAGIVVGVLAILYIGETSGVTLNPETVERQTRPVTQLLAAMTLSLSFCVLLQQEKATVLAATLNGGVAWLIFGAMHDTANLSPFAATAVGAGMVGLFGQLQARYRFTSALPYVTASIGPLLPGSAVYFGLLGFAQGNVATGGEYLLRAATLALAIAIGVNLGSEIARLFIRSPGRLTSPTGRRGAKRTRGF
ncbi:threonine/serine exporter family protein [Streptomyces sp. ACA25]|uniref:threonine/serine ThrE exporter family protein n=1 Tax=Streptomyces sp. ACA25 TaxID=3022596 RepID=UPI002307541D|nr:threonine/serine exporter family protein [Streptomyces sp. ACA25]MDB1086634.1 threonine/serine exporter family protein [Streptomyces sp. ACA25]